MKILSTLFCLGAAVVLSGCQTVSNENLSPEKPDLKKTEETASSKAAKWETPHLNLQKPAAQPQPPRQVKPKSSLDGILLNYDQYGSVKIRISQDVYKDTSGLKNKLLDTISGKAKRGGTDLALVYPRSETFPLGTIFEKSSIQGFSVTYDTSFAAQYQKDVQTTKFKSTIVSGFINEISQNMLLRPHERPALFAELSNPDPDSVTSISMNVNASSGRVEILPYSASQKLAKHLMEAGLKSNEGYYFIADKIVWAKEISYFIGPGRIQGHHLNKRPTSGIDPHDIRLAKQNGVNIRDVNGVLVITERFDKEKIVAVGFSIFPNISKLGDSKIGFGDQPKLADIYYTHSTPLSVLR